MKVTMVAREYPPYVYGGAGVHLKNLAPEMAKLMDVEVRCFGDQSEKSKNLTVKGYKFNKPDPRKDPLFATALETFAVDLGIVREPIDSDVIHTHTWYAHFAGYLAKMLYNIPFIAVSHSLEPLRPWKRDQLGTGFDLSTWAEKTGLEGADRVIAVSALMKEDIINNFNVPEERVAVIHNGINLEKWKETPLNESLKKEYGIKDKYILFIGRPTPQKGLEYLVQARDMIDPDTQIVLGAVGADTKEYEDKMTREVEKKKNMVWIHKMLKEEEYVQLYSGAKVFVCPSVYEPFGIINLEAMATRTPVVASATGGIKEVVVHEETGLLVEPKNAKQIADGVNRILKDEALQKKFAENGRKRVEKYFSWTYIAEQTKKLYESLLK